MLAHWAQLQMSLELAAVFLFCGLVGCGSNVTAPSARRQETYRGTLPFSCAPSAPCPAPVIEYPIPIIGTGALDATLTWAIAPSGSSGAPEMYMYVSAERPAQGFSPNPVECGWWVAGPSASSPLSLTIAIPKDPCPYHVGLGMNTDCGGCQVDYELTVLVP
jgi:hypothetical protein